ncbi:MAG TPA: amidase family protein [Candidatus Acidoferrales bacterium]|nr:amidase family protein [Candidatus Acidoferrales bacterium]
MSFSGYSKFDGLGLAELVVKRDVTPLELVEEAISRIEKHNPTLNAVVYKMYDEARATANAQANSSSGPFRGVPFLLKDILGNYAGVPTTSACRFQAGVPALRDDTLVARFKAAGLIAVGKTNVPECGILPTTESAFYGPAHNPWNLKHSTGGSSGGSAAAVAAGIVPLAHANDGGGSIRIPASCCGLVGLKPTRARNPMGPDIGDFANGLIAEHIVSRSVRDTAAALDCTHGPEAGDPYFAPHVPRPFLEEARTPPGRLRIAFSKTLTTGVPLHPDCVRAVESTAKLLEELGHTVEEAMPPIDAGMVTSSFLTVFTAAHAAAIDGFAFLNGKVPQEEDFEGLTWAIYQSGKQIPATQYLISIAMLQIVSRQVGRFHETYDAWLTTTLGTPPVELGKIDIHERDPLKGLGQLADYVPVTPLQNATGQPAISLPLHWNDAGLPIGLMFTAALGGEGTLLRLAGQLEEARPWRDRKPPVWS